VGEHFAIAADFHFGAPVFLGFPVTKGSVDEPAKVAGFELVCRTL
jgi:hypothetical protein